MPHVRLTDITISKFPQSKNRVTYWDEGLPAFGVRVGARRKTFVVIVKPGHRIKLGNYPTTTLKDARNEAHRRLATRDGFASEVAPPTEEVVKKFLEVHHAKSRPRWRKEQERLLTKHLLSKHKEVRFNRITTKDILAITDSLKELPSEQLHAFRAMKTLFSWAQKRKMIAASPLDGLARPNQPADRDRVLSDKELISIYRTAQKIGYPFGQIILVCIHTAMRRGEVGALKRSYVSDEAITLPAELVKNGREHVLPNLIGAELAAVRSPEGSDYYFPNASGGAFSSWGRHKSDFDEMCGVTNWTLHDIRRTVRTKLAEWGCCDDATAERILGHVSAESRIGRIYNRWKHFPQMKAALEVYEQKLAALLAAT